VSADAELACLDAAEPVLERMRVAWFETLRQWLRERGVHPEVLLYLAHAPHDKDLRHCRTCGERWPCDDRRLHAEHLRLTGRQYLVGDNAKTPRHGLGYPWRGAVRFFRSDPPCADPTT